VSAPGLAVTRPVVVPPSPAAASLASAPRVAPSGQTDPSVAIIAAFFTSVIDQPCEPSRAVSLLKAMIVAPGLQTVLFAHSRMKDPAATGRVLSILASASAPVSFPPHPTFVVPSASAQAEVEQSAFESKSIAVKLVKFKRGRKVSIERNHLDHASARMH
jgi:hypothetical protein